MKDHCQPGERLLLVVQDPTYELGQGIPPAQHQHGSVRRLTHDGHEIEVHTHYRVVIDGKEYPDPFHVMNDGTVTYHGLPQYQTASAVDLVKRIVDELLADEPRPIGESSDRHHGDRGGSH
jgi:hypothetical protein